MTIEKAAHLSWVNAPVQKALKDCLALMAKYASIRDTIATPPVGAEPIWFANQRDALEATYDSLFVGLTRIDAALDMTQCVGGAVLAKEIKILATVLASMESAADQDRAIHAMQDAIGVLPSYINMVIEGAPDSAGVLMRYINELRALRGVSQLSDSSALPINLTFSYKSPPLYEQDCDVADRESVFRNAAEKFCKLYSVAMKDQEPQPWIEMLHHMRELQRVTNDPELGSYWWVGEALIDVIIADGLFLPPAMNAALRVVMVATQKLPQGEKAAKASLSPARFAAMLNSLSICRKQTEISEQILRYFDVQKNVEADHVQQLQTLLQSQNVSTIADVIPEIKPRLEAAMVAFGRAVTSKYAEGFKLQTQAFDQSIRTIANVFGIFNELELSELCFQLADMIKGVESPKAFSQEVVDQVKAQIIFLDSKLTHLERNEAAEHLQIRNVTPDVIKVIAEVTYAEIKKVCQMISVHVDSGAGSEKLLSALNSLHEVASVYEFTGSAVIGGVLTAVVSTITERVSHGVLSDSAYLRHPARALSCIELYLQYITSGLQPPPSLLEQASGAIRELGIDVSSPPAITQSALLAKFDEAEQYEEDAIDPLLREIFELRSALDVMAQDDAALRDNRKLSAYSSACLRMSSAAAIKGEKHFQTLCRHASGLAVEVAGRAGTPGYDTGKAAALLKHASDMITRAMDDYSTKGKVNVFLVNVSEELAEFMGVAEVDFPAEDPAPTPAVVLSKDKPSEPAAPAYPEGVDPVLQQLFDEEFTESLEVITGYLSSALEPIPVHVCRAAHTIVGCSGSAGCEAVHSVFGQIEGFLYDLHAQGLAPAAGQVEVLRSLLAQIAAYQRGFPWTTDAPLLDAWLGVCDDLNFAASGQVAAGTSEPNPEPETDQAIQLPLVVTEVESLDIPETPDAPLHAEIEPEFDTDPDQVELYLCDADEVIPELQQNVESWMDQPDDKDLAVSIRRNMHTLKGAAAIINAVGIRDLTHHMETLFDAVASGAVAGEACSELVNFVLGELVTMTAAVRMGKGYRTNTGLIEFIEKASETFHVDGEELRNVISATYTTASAATPPEPEITAGETAIGTATPSAAESSIQAMVDSQAADPVNDAEDAAVPAAPTVDSDDSGQTIEAVPEAEIAKEAEGLSATDEDGNQTRRGYRGLRGRAVGERQKNWERRQELKQQYAEAAAAAERDSVPADVQQPEQEAEPEAIKPSELVATLLNAMESTAPTQKVKKQGAEPEKIRVQPAMLDSMIQQANEVKAASYRQSTLFRDVMLSVSAVQEKMALALMHHNKFTVLLRNFNNLKNPMATFAEGDLSDDEKRQHLERFNVLSAGNNQAGVQIEQMLADLKEIISQSQFMQAGFKHQGEVVTDLHKNLIRCRLAPFNFEKQNLFRAVEGACNETGKKATVELIGGDTQVDRMVTESLRDPLRHILTNAVAHGIEAADDREAAGKLAAGKITVTVFNQSKSLIIEVADDGRGIDPQSVRRKAISKGLLKPNDTRSDQQLIELITINGFSTADTVSRLSGRGVGMDIVRSKINMLGGELYISSALGKGTTMRLVVPLTITSNRALISHAGDQWFAIPTHNVVQVLDYPLDEMTAIRRSGAPRLQFEGDVFEVVHLADLIAMPDLKIQASEAATHTTLILVQTGTLNLAIEVDGRVLMPEIHVTKFDGIMSTVKGIIGGTEIHDGTPALVLDVAELARLNLRMGRDGYKPLSYRIRKVARENRPVVLIVDDSNSYRHLLSKHFDGLGWSVEVARDGQDAIEKLQTIEKPTMFVVDVEMPRMNGIDFTTQIRGQDQYNDTPIIMLTTRATLKERAIELGVNQFLSKPYDPTALNEAVKAEFPYEVAQ